MRTPVFWLALAYGAGLALFYRVDDSPGALFLLGVGFLLAGLLSLRHHWLRLTLACALAGFFLAGGATIRLVAASVSPERVDRLLATKPIDLREAVRLTGWLRRDPEDKPLSLVYEMEVETLEQGGHRYLTRGGARLSYFRLREPGEPAEPVPALRYGDRVEVLARVHPPTNHDTPGSFDWRGYLARRDVHLVGSLKSFLLLRPLPGRRGHRWYGWLQELRATLLGQLDRLYPADTQPARNAVLRAMLLGDRGFLAPRLKEDFRRSGAYHVLVVSGLHVGMMAFFLFWATRRLAGSELTATLVTLPALVIYLLLVEDRPPVERAVWMVGLYLIARLLFRRVHLANPVALAALLVLFLHPLWVFEPSFHLSFAAVFLIAFFAVPWMERTSAPYREALSFLDAEDREDLRPARLAQFRLDLRLLVAALAAPWPDHPAAERRARRLLTGSARLALAAWDFFLISFAIHLGFVLLTAFYFDRVIWAGLLTNLLVVPLVSLVVPLGAVALLASLVWLPLGALLAAPVSLLVGALLRLVEGLAGSGLSYGIPPPPLWVVALYLAALTLLGAAVSRAERSPRFQRGAAVLLAVLVLVVATYPFPAPSGGESLETTVLDVGQGDAVFLAFPNGEKWLVDAGRGPVEVHEGYEVGRAAGRNVVVPFLRQRGLKRLDRVWLTHAQLDHMGGLAAVLEEFTVGSFHVGRNPASDAYTRLLADVHARGIPLRHHRRGEAFAVGDVRAEVLWPPPDYVPGARPSNNDSLVLRLCVPGRPAVTRCVLLPGDIEPAVERELAERGDWPVAAAALKVPHHGGRGAAGEEFLAAVSPTVALLSVGAHNPFGHPFPAVVERLRAHTEGVYRTDRDGSIRVRLGREEIRVDTFHLAGAETYANLWARLAACTRRLLSLKSKQWAADHRLPSRKPSTKKRAASDPCN